MLSIFTPEAPRIEKELRAVALTTRNRALLTSYLHDCPVAHGAEFQWPADEHHIQDLYRVTPAPTRGKDSGAWFFDVSNLGENFQRFANRSCATFHVCEALMAGAENFWREDLDKVMARRSPVAGRLTVFTDRAGYEIEHLALPVFEGATIASIVGAFDFLDGGPIDGSRISWPDVDRVERHNPSNALQDATRLRRGRAGRTHGDFHRVFQVLPKTRPFWLRSTPDEIVPEGYAPQHTDTP